MGVETRVALTSEHSARNGTVTHAVLHHGATTSLAAIEQLMEPGGRQVSAHYAVKDNERVLKVPLHRRAWSLSSERWDSAAVTVECANHSTQGWTISDASHESLALIVADAGRRFGFTPHRNGDPRTWTVLGHREVFTIHGASYATACPGGMDLDRIARRAHQLLSPTPRRNDPMAFIAARNGTFWLVTPGANGALERTVLGAQDVMSGFPTIDFKWDTSWNQFQEACKPSATQPASIDAAAIISAIQALPEAMRQELARSLAS